MTEALSGQQSAARNLARFQAWVAERRSNNDWHDYANGGKLSRKDIAAECDFALSVLRQNPAVRDALEKLEVKLRDEGILSQWLDRASGVGTGEAGSSSHVDVASSMAADARSALLAASAEKRVKALEEKNASLLAEIQELQRKLKQYALLDAHLGETGRLLPHE